MCCSLSEVMQNFVDHPFYCSNRVAQRGCFCSNVTLVTEVSLDEEAVFRMYRSRSASHATVRLPYSAELLGYLH